MSFSDIFHIAVFSVTLAVATLLVIVMIVMTYQAINRSQFDRELENMKASSTLLAVHKRDKK